MQFWRTRFTIFTLVMLAGLAAMPSDLLAEITIKNRWSWAQVYLSLCDNPRLRSETTDYEPFSATYQNSRNCEQGIADGSIQYSDSLSFAGLGSLTGVFAGGSATSSATHLDEDDHFHITGAHGQGYLAGITFQVVDEPALFELNGTATAAATGPNTVAEVVVSLLRISGAPVKEWIVFVQGDSTAGPIVWHEEGELQPGDYSIQMHVRASCTPDWETANIANTASASFSGSLTFRQSVSTVVNSTRDAQDINPGDGVCDTGGPMVDGRPECTLRAAIMESNATVGPDRITFEIPVSDPGHDPTIQAFRIRPQPPVALPEITQPVIIDGTTQAVAASGGAAEATTSTSAASAAVAGTRPTVILDGTDLGTGNDGLHGLDISAGDSEVRGLAITRFHGHGIYLHGNGNNKVQGNFIGLAPGITTPAPGGMNRDGIRIDGIANNLIGGFPDTDRNVIASNGLLGTVGCNIHIMNATAINNDIIGNYIGTGDKGLVAMDNANGVFIDRAPGNTVVSNVIAGNLIGVRILGAESQDNSVEGNLIGIGADGSLAVPNTQAGISIETASFNTIGGPTAKPGTISGNVISGNRSTSRTVHGINILGESKHNRILGNLIGTDQTGKLPRGNGGAGIHIELADSNEVGGPDAQDLNVIADNDSGGVVIKSNGNMITGNFIGLDIDGDAAVGNKHYGIRVHDKSDNTIRDNVVSGNLVGGILIRGNAASKHNRILGNLIGTDQLGKLPRGNSGAGVSIVSADSNEVGGLNAQDRNVIGDNDLSGLIIKSNGNTVTGNFIGADIDGDAELGNKRHGIHIDNSADNTIDDNLVSGNQSGGILVEGKDARKNRISGNAIGTKSDRMNALGNIGDGVTIDGAHENRIENSLISGNQGSGILLLNSSSANVLMNNLIGTKQNGDEALPNTVDGVLIGRSAANVLEGNTVSGNGVTGVSIVDQSDSNVVVSNNIGVSSDGLKPLGNGEDGVFLNNATNSDVNGNVISANGRYGVYLVGGADSDLIANTIGMNADQSLSIGNTKDGIHSLGTERTRIDSNIIVANGFNGVHINDNGDVTQNAVVGNDITGNGQNGIRIERGLRNPIRSNRISENTLLGIDLDPAGITPNDEMDGDAGPNNLQNFPILKIAFEDTLALTTTLIGFLRSTPNTTFDIDLFGTAACDASGNGEGEFNIESFQVTTGAGGVAGFARKYPFLFVNKLFTSTATDDMGNTSEFSNCIAIEDGGNMVIVNSTGDVGDTNPGDGMCSTGGTNSEGETECTLRAAIEEINAQAGSQTVIFDIPGGGPYTMSPATELPAVVGQAVLDATTQAGFAGAPVIEIDGSGAAGTDGLTLSGGGVTVRGFVVNQFNGHGIVVGGNGAHVVELNYIGTDVAGSQDLGNRGHGVRVSNGDNSRIGGLEAGTANVIAFNDSDGVHVSAGRANSIPRNSIHSNDRLGINLAGGNETVEGVTANDDGDDDNGPNALQNFPALDRAIVNGDELVIEGTLSGVADATYHIEVFGNSECDASGFGEGSIYLGSFELTLTGGAPAFNVTLPLDGTSTGAFVTTTATDAGGNTSEFSPCVAAEVAPLVLSLGVLQNPYLSQFLDIFMVASAEVDPQSVVLTVGGEDVPMTLADAAENLWKADYELDGDGTLPVEVCATGLTGSAACASTSVAALFASEGVPVDLQSVDGRLMVRVTGSDITAAGFVVIIPSTDSGSPAAFVKDAFPVLVGAGTVAGDALAGYTVSASNLAERSVITVEFRFKDLVLVPGTVLSQLLIHHDGAGRLASVVDPGGGVIRATATRAGTYELRVGPAGSSRVADKRFLRLDPNYPNPFNPSTTIQYELQTRQHVRLTIYDALGRRVVRLVDEVVPAGIQRFLWTGRTDGGGIATSGVYFVRLETQDSEATRKMVLIR